jgi:hypothetical protein
MSKLKAAALVAILFLTPAAAEAQYRYDWSTGNRTGHQALKAGVPVAIQITGLNTLCYQPHARVTISEASVDLSGFLTGLGRKPSGDQPPTPPAAPPSRQGLPASPPDPSSLTMDEERAYTLRVLEEAALRFAEADALGREAGYFTGVLASPPCHLGRGWSIDHFAARWRNQSASLLGGLSMMRDGLQHTAEQLDLAGRAMAGGSSIGDADLRARIGVARQTLRERQRTIASGLAALTEARPHLDALEQTTQMHTAVNPGHNAEGMRIVVQMVPLETTARDVPADTLDEALYRRFRIVLSTGTFITFGSQPEFRRVNRPFVRDSVAPDGAVVPVPTDSTYSTYAAQRRGVLDVFSPSVQFNITLGERWSGIPSLLSFGAAGRSVNGTLIPEPFAGVGIGIIDRFIVSGGAHFGRSEVLLINLPGETAADVERRPVPGTVTPADAVGVEWRVRPYLTLSVKP